MPLIDANRKGVWNRHLQGISGLGVLSHVPSLAGLAFFGSRAFFLRMRSSWSKRRPKRLIDSLMYLANSREIRRGPAAGNFKLNPQPGGP